MFSRYTIEAPVRIVSNSTGNSYALETIRDAMEEDPSLEVTLPHAACEYEVSNALAKCFKDIL